MRSALAPAVSSPHREKRREEAGKGLTPAVSIETISLERDMRPSAKSKASKSAIGSKSMRT